MCRFSFPLFLSLACLDCLFLSSVLPFLSHPSLSILVLWYPLSPLSLLFLSQCFFSSHLWHNIRSKPFVLSLSLPFSSVLFLKSVHPLTIILMEILSYVTKCLFLSTSKHIQAVFTHVANSRRVSSPPRL